MDREPSEVIMMRQVESSLVTKLERATRVAASTREILAQQDADVADQQQRLDSVRAVLLAMTEGADSKRVV